MMDGWMVDGWMNEELFPCSCLIFQLQPYFSAYLPNETLKEMSKIILSISSLPISSLI
jgi:hypothetical protein